MKHLKNRVLGNVFPFPTKKNLLLSFFILNAIASNAAIIQSKNSGTWNDKNMWVNGSVPSCGDSIIINTGHLVKLNATPKLNACNKGTSLVIGGTLEIRSSTNLDLSVNSGLYILQSGMIKCDLNKGVYEIRIAGQTVWANANGNLNGPSCLPSKLCTTPLPIVLGNMNATSTQNNKVLISWWTASEDRSDYFTLEQSNDGENFNLIATLKAAGFSATRKDYDIEVTQIEPATIYYRLSEVSIDGIKSTFPLISYNYENTNGFNVFPNPVVENKFKIILPYSTLSQTWTLQITDLSGKLLFLNSYKTEGQSNIDVLLNGNTNSGYFIASLTSSQNCYRKKILLE